MKRLLALLLSMALCLAAGAVPVSVRAAEPEYTDSGCVDIPKLTKQQQVALLDGAPVTAFYWGEDILGDTFEEVPSVAAPHTPGRVKQQVLEQTLVRLNALRAIGGLPAVALDGALCSQAQYGAVLLAAGEFSHFSPKPADMSEEFYNAGLAATSSSNISAGRYLTSTPDGFMDDSSAGNIPMVGHRRWQLNPALGKVGFGFAYNPDAPYKCYTAEKVFDQSGSYGEYTFVSWPPSGNFPVSGASYWTVNTPFSVTLNPRKYAAPRMEEITVTLRRQADGASWTFSGKESYAPSAARYMNVDTDGYGVSNCIIFRPDGVEAYEGIYTVTLTGLKDNGGNSAALSYQIDFFDPEDYRGSEPDPKDPEQPADPRQPGDAGDVDGDGKVTSTDARLTLQLAVEKIDREDLAYPAAADVDGDGKVTSTDARMILQYSVGKIDGFPVTEKPIAPGNNELPLQ